MFGMWFKQNLFIVIKHIMVSSMSATIELSIFWMLSMEIKTTLLTAHAVAFFCASMVGFIMHSMLTFSIGKLKCRNAALFCVQASFLLVLGYQILKILIEKEIEPIIAKLIQLVINFTLNVLIGKYITFKK